MVINKRKKNSRQRGSHTHGWGAKKKHRGSGNRGGKGNAGTGKRADQKKPSIWTETYFGRYGFKTKSRIKIKPININYVDLNASKLGENKNGAFTIDLAKAGFNKLLGAGKITKKLNVTVDFASSNAIEKVTKAGGSVTTKKKGEKQEDGTV